MTAPHHASGNSNTAPQPNGAKSQVIKKTDKAALYHQRQTGGSVLAEKILAWASETLVDCQF